MSTSTSTDTDNDTAAAPTKSAKRNSYHGPVSYMTSADIQTMIDEAAKPCDTALKRLIEKEERASFRDLLLLHDIVESLKADPPFLMYVTNKMRIRANQELLLADFNEELSKRIAKIVDQRQARAGWVRFSQHIETYSAGTEFAGVLMLICLSTERGISEQFVVDYNSDGSMKSGTVALDGKMKLHVFKNKTLP